MYLCVSALYVLKSSQNGIGLIHFKNHRQIQLYYEVLDLELQQEFGGQNAAVEYVTRELERTCCSTEGENTQLLGATEHWGLI